jgi:hypothetical protein
MFRKNEVTVKLYTYEPNHFELFKLRKATKDYPEWFKKLPSEYYKDGFIPAPVPTAKRCPAIIDYFKKSMVIPSQFDVYLKADHNNDSGWLTPTQETATMIKTFNTKQKIGFNIPHVKIDTSWICVEETGINFMLVDAYYNNFNEPWRIIPGILDFKYQHSLNINVAYNRQDDPIFIPVDTPLSFMIPLTEKDVKYEHYLVSNDEWKQIKRKSETKNTFLSKYVKYKKLKQRFDLDTGFMKLLNGRNSRQHSDRET